MKESEIPKLNSVFWTASPCPMFIRKDWKSLWIVQSETTVDVTVLCNGCILPEHRALLSTHCMTGSPPPPKTRWIAWAAATSLVPVCPAPSPQQIWPHSLPSSAQLSTALWGCWPCPPHGAASDSALLLFVCPSKLNMLPQQPKCLMQYLLA